MKTTRYKVRLHVMQLEKGDYHTLIDGSVACHRVRIVLDTGASHSCMDASFAKEIFPEIQATEHEGVTAGIGGDDFQVRVADIPDFRIGRYKRSIFKDMALLDFSYINMAYVRLNKKPVQIILGNDFFVQHKAVIHYEDRYLYFNADKTKK